MNIELKKKKERRNYIVRHALFVLLMAFCYVFISSVNTGGALPVLLIPCAVCYAVREAPFDSVLYGCVCGLLLDSASGTLTGFNALILMWSCLMISLLFHYVLRRHILNFLWLDMAVIVIQSMLHYLFFYFLWEFDPSGLVFRKIFIPEIIWTNIWGIVLYWLTGIISRGFGTVTEHYIEEKSEDIVRE
ncbi:MAG: rod shape-determining protein MreD [Huintestinicola sp.]